MYFLGGAVNSEKPASWNKILNVARGTIYNGYCKNDYILMLYKYSMFKTPLGLGPLLDIEQEEEPKNDNLAPDDEQDEQKIDVNVMNLDVTEEAHGHIYYRTNLKSVLEAMDFHG